jgi:hypothetical protein
MPHSEEAPQGKFRDFGILWWPMTGKDAGAGWTIAIRSTRAR